MFSANEPGTRAGDTAPPALPPGQPLRERRQSPGVANRRLLDPVALLADVWKARPWIVVAMLFGAGLALFYALHTPKLYTASAQLIVDPRDLNLVQNEVTPNGLPSEAALALIESQISVVSSNNVLKRVVLEAELTADPEFNGTEKGLLASLLPDAVNLFANDPEAGLRDRELVTMLNFRNRLEVVRETNSFVLNLSVESRDAAKAARLANLTAEIFIGEQGRIQSDTARRATAALTSRLAELRQRVVDAEREVERYKAENRLIGVGGRLVDDEYILRINNQLADTRGDITTLNVRASSMQAASVEDVVEGTFPEELNSEALVRLRQSYSELAQGHAVLSARLGPRHPQRIASDGALEASRRAIEGELARIVAAAQTELSRARQTERDLTAQIDELKTQQIETSGSFVKLRELERDVDASRAVYEAYILRARETSQQESLNTANVRVISEATPPRQPSSLSRKVMLVVGAMLGLGLGVGLAAVFAAARLLRRAFAGSRSAPAVDPVRPGPSAADPAGDADAARGADPAAGLRPGLYPEPPALRGGEGSPTAGMEAQGAPSPAEPVDGTDDRGALVSDADAAAAPATRTDAAAAEARQAARLRERIRAIGELRALDAPALDAANAQAARPPAAPPFGSRPLADIRRKRLRQAPPA